MSNPGFPGCSRMRHRYPQSRHNPQKHGFSRVHWSRWSLMIQVWICEGRCVMGDVSLVTPLFLRSRHVMVMVMVMVILEWADQLKTSGVWQVWQFQDQDVLEFEKVHCHVWWGTERAKSLECVRCGFDEAKFIMVETQHGCIETQCLNHQNKSCITKRRPAAAAPMKQRAAASPLKRPSVSACAQEKISWRSIQPMCKSQRTVWHPPHPTTPHPTPAQSQEKIW